MYNFDNDLNKLRMDPSSLSLIGSITKEVSHNIINIDDGYIFFRALLANLIGENIQKNFIEDDLRSSITQYASCLISLSTDNGFKEAATAFGTLYRKLLQNKKRPHIKKINDLEYYEGVDNLPLLIKNTSDKHLKFLDTDIILSKVLPNKTLTSAFIGKIKEAIDIHKVSKLCFVEKRKGPLGTLLMLSQIVQETETSAFIYRASYFDDVSRIKGQFPINRDITGIVYDSSITGGGIEEIIEYLKKTFQNRVAFAAVVVDYDKGAKERLLNNFNVNLISMLKKDDIETGYKEQIKNFVKGEYSKNKIPVRLKNPEQEDSFLDILYANRIPFTSYYGGDKGDVYEISREDKELLEQLDFIFEEAKIIRLSTLPFEKSLAIKKRQIESMRKVKATSDKELEDTWNKFVAAVDEYVEEKRVAIEKI